MNNEPFRLRYANRIVGVFLLILLALITSTAILLTNLSGVMAKRVEFFCSLPESEAAGIQKGTEIIQLGERIGRVTSLEYVEDSEQVRLQLSINPPYEQSLNTSSHLSLERKFGVGASYLKVRRSKVGDGTADVKKLIAGDEIPFVSQPDPLDTVAGNVGVASSSIQTIQQEMTPTLRSVQSASDSLTQSMSDQINPATERGKAAFESIETTSNLLREQSSLLTSDLHQLATLTTNVLSNDVRTSLNSVIAASEAAKEAANNVASTSLDMNEKTDLTNAEIVKTLGIMKDTLLLMQKLTNESRQVVQIIRGEANVIPETTAKINSAVDDTQDLMDELRSHWLMRNVRKDSAGDKQISPTSIRAGGTRQ